MIEDSQTIASYSCSQLFGYKSQSQKLLEEDNITTMKFDRSGRFLALGDKAGRLIVFHSPQELEQRQEYDYYSQFQAHQQDFDTLKNKHVPNAISHIHWMRPQGRYNKLLTANTHTVKMWKMFQKKPVKKKRASIRDCCPDSQLEQANEQDKSSSVCVNLKEQFKNQSFSPINSFGLSANEEYMFTADQGQLLLWSLQKTNSPFLLRQFEKNLRDSAKSSYKSEKITCARLHPQNQSLFALGTNKGKLNVIDSRISISCPDVLEFNSTNTQNNFISDIIQQYTSVTFLADHRKVATRDLTSVKIWDMTYNREPLLDIPIDQDIKQHVHQLFQAQVLEDKFSVTQARSGIVTGNYGNSFQIMDPGTGQNVQYQLDFGQQTKARRVGGDIKRCNPFNPFLRVHGHDFNEQTSQLAVSTSSCFFIFSQGQTQPKD